MNTITLNKLSDTNHILAELYKLATNTNFMVDLLNGCLVETMIKFF